MQKFFAVFIVLSLLFSASSDARPALSVHSRMQDVDVNVNLSDAQWRWLGQKKILRIATWEPQVPPFDIVLPDNIFEGISADYLKIVTTQLGVSVNVLRYASRDAALLALKEREVDAVIDVPGTTQAGAAFSDTRSYMPNYPALVAKENSGSALPALTKPFKLAVASYYLTDDEIHTLYPHALITRFPNLQTAFDAIAHADFDYLLGNTTSVSFLIDRIYNNALYIISTSRSEGRGGRFIVRNEDRELLDALNAVLSSLTSLHNEAIVDSWFLGADLSWMNRPLKLTADEQRWLKAHPVVRVMYNPLDAPLSMEDKNGDVYGISEDVLRLISLRTGITFSSQTEPDEDRQIDELLSGKVDMLAALPFTEVNRQRVALSSPYIFTVYVLVTGKNEKAPLVIPKGKKIALVSDRRLEEQMRRRYPGAEFIKVTNSTLALKKVDDGEAVAAIDHQIGATFLIDHYFPQLKIMSRVTPDTAQLGFALPKGSRELESIINKSLLDIPPRTFTKIFNKWQGTPEIQLKTWQVYSKAHYIVISFTLAISLLLLGWGGTLLLSNRSKKRTQKELERQLAFSHSLLNGSPTPTYVIDSKGNIISANNAWRQYFSAYDSSTLALSLHDRRHPLASIYATLLEGMVLHTGNDSAIHSNKFALSNGIIEATIEHWAALLSSENEAKVNLICGWHDVTEHETLLKALSFEKDNADRANSAKSSFLATMSHEIRTPISAVIGLLELAEHSRTSDTPDGEAIRLAYTSAQSVLELIGDVLDMAKIESGNLDLSPAWVRADSVISGTVLVFEGLARQKNIDLYWDNQLACDIEIYIDQQRLKQILFNFISNAIKFTHIGNVSIILSGDPVNQNEHLIRLTVADTGIGISDTGKEKLFVPYSQLEPGKKQVGTGLGLVISAELIELMDGTLEMHSQLNEGTTLTVTFTVPFRLNNSIEQLVRTKKNRHTRSLTILIADDQATNRHLLSRQLMLFGHHVETAENGAEALAIWDEKSIDLVITDCHMPVMGGRELSRTLRSRGASVPVWGLTADAQPDEIARNIAAGMEQCFIKPFQLDQLEHHLELLEKGSMPEFPFNMTALKRLCGEDDTLLLQVVEKTIQEIDADIAEAEKALMNQDWNRLSHYLHRLTGTAGLVGASDTAGLCTELESMARHAPDSQALTEEWQPLKDSFNQISARLTDWLKLKRKNE